MKVVVAALNQEKALVGAFSVITNLRMEPFEALVPIPSSGKLSVAGWWWRVTARWRVSAAETAVTAGPRLPPPPHASLPVAVVPVTAKTAVTKRSPLL